MTDTAPDQVIVTVESDVLGYLGTAAVVAAANTSRDVQTTGWSLTAGGLASGSHVITATATDEAGISRSASIVILVP